MIEVIINKKTGYVNVTKLCKDGGKEFKSWNKNNSSIEFVKFISKTLGLTRDQLIFTITGGQNTTIRGTYVHPDIIPHIASW